MCILCGKMHTPLRFVCVFQKSAGSNNQFLDSCVLMYVPNNFHSFKNVWHKKILVYVIGISQILIQKKICHIPELRIYQKLFILSNFYQKICKKCANSTKKGILKPQETKKEQNRPLMKFKYIVGTVTKNFEILKIAGSRAEFLDLTLKFKTFFENSI